ncbi:MAG: hypothetical protein J1F35_01790 [Erysipelotrichales bacterium]|nr:hypothetical protein [Erysipelotrichales bacterium]
MKKKYIACLLLFIFSMLIGNTNVFAVRVKTKVGSYSSTGIQYDPHGSGAEVNNYRDAEKYVVVNGQEFIAYCVDPGLHLNSGNDYDCTPTSDAGLIYIVEQARNLDYVTAQLSARFYAVYRGLGGIGSSENTNLKASIARYAQLRLKGGNTLQAACEAMGKTCSSSYNDYLFGNTSVIEKAFDISVEARSISKSVSNASGGLTFTKSAASTKDRIIYTVTSYQKVEKMKFVCDGCTIIGSDTIEGSSGTLEVAPAPDCEPFTIKAYYVPSGVSICKYFNSSVSENYQYLVADFEASGFVAAGSDSTGGSGGSSDIDTSGEPMDEYQDTGIECKEECCTERDIEPGYIIGEINNCCYDGTHSWAREYNLNEMFCYSDELLVNHYWEMCNTESYIDTKMQGYLNEYCNIYCTERVTVDIPGAVTATSGRYFELTTTSYGTKSPYVQGFKRCRMQIHFKKWQDDYRKQVEEQVKQYNLYQEYRLKQYVYQEAVDTKKQCNLRIKVVCTGEEDSDSRTCSNGYQCNVKASTKNVDGTHFNQSKDYFQYKFDGYHNGKNWNTIKLKEQGFKDAADGYYNYYEMIYDKSIPYTHELYSYYTVKEMIEEAERVKSEKESITDVQSNGCCTARAGVKCDLDWYDSCGNQLEDLKNKDEDVESELERLTGLANTAKAAFNAAANNAKELEEKIDKCDKFFEEYEGTNAQDNYPFNAMFFGFEYTQIYLADYGDLRKDVMLVPFSGSPGCQISGPILGPDAEDGLVAPQYSTLYHSDGITETTDFKVSDLEWGEDTQWFKKYLDELYEADQKFVQDAKYQANCSWDEPDNTKYTLVPNGNIQEEEFNVTKNDRQYQIYLSTLEGTYDTRWLLSGLGVTANGATGKFDAFFAENGAVCSGKQTAASDGLFHCGIKVEWEIINTGKCNGSKTTVDPSECELITGTELVLTFKVVDPSQVFTCSSYSSCGYGYNWFEGKNGSETLAAIKRKGENGSTYAPSSVTYQISLNSRDMRHIKNYNEERENNNYGGYSDFSLLCDCPEESESCNAVSDQTCKRSQSCNKCRSVFLEDLYKGYVTYNGTKHSVSGAKGSIGTIRDSGLVHWAER